MIENLVPHMFDVNGGPAFPVTVAFKDYQGQSLQVVSHGMSLRDWFAGQALAGMVVDPVTYDGLAEEAYRLADAMLAARKPRP